jgi:hypothetical protein
VDPRGLEPLTSAMRGRLQIFVGVRGRSEHRLSTLAPYSSRLHLFADIRPGNCQVTVKSPSAQGCCPRFMRVEARFAHRLEQYLLLL